MGRVVGCFTFEFFERRLVGSLRGGLNRSWSWLCGCWSSRLFGWWRQRFSNNKRWRCHGDFWELRLWFGLRCCGSDWLGQRSWQLRGWRRFWQRLNRLRSWRLWGGSWLWDNRRWRLYYLRSWSGSWRRNRLRRSLRLLLSRLILLALAVLLTLATLGRRRLLRLLSWLARATVRQNSSVALLLCFFTHLVLQGLLGGCV